MRAPLIGQPQPLIPPAMPLMQAQPALRPSAMSQPTAGPILRQPGFGIQKIHFLIKNLIHFFI